MEPLPDVNPGFLGAAHGPWLAIPAKNDVLCLADAVEAVPVDWINFATEGEGS